MFSNTLFVQKMFIFIYISLIYSTYLMAKNVNQTKYCALNFTKCFISYLSVPDDHHKWLLTCRDVSFAEKK